MRRHQTLKPMRRCIACRESKPQDELIRFTFDGKAVAADENGKFGSTQIECESCNSYEEEIRHFVDCLNTGKQPISPIGDAVTVQRMLDGIYRSTEAHAEVGI